MIMEDVVVAPVAAQETADAGYGSGATQIFSRVGSQAPRARGAQRGFATRTAVGFPDQPVQRCAGERPRGAGHQRIQFAGEPAAPHRVGSGLFFSLICLTGFVVSFFRNRALETRVQEAVADLSTLQTAINQPAGVGDLTKLDNLRGELVDLSDYEEHGAPCSLRWGLYEGDQI